MWSSSEFEPESNSIRTRSSLILLAVFEFESGISIGSSNSISAASDGNWPDEEISNTIRSELLATKSEKSSSDCGSGETGPSALRFGPKFG
jgi:hypothetical protein